MKKALILILIFISVAAKATTYYVATNGNNSNPGTLSQPWATWNYGITHIKAGDILYIRGGTYTGVAGGGTNQFGVRADGLAGTSGAHYLISAYPGETPILDCSSLTSTTGQNVAIGLYNSSYVDFVGLTVINCTQHAVNAFAAPGFYESNVSYITHTRCTIHHCGDGFTIRDSYNYIYYTNCDVYEIADTYNDPSGALPGSLANGFYCAPAPGTHIYYTGCRAWNCSDDGWDEFGGGGYIEITNCWAFNNGWCDAGGPIASTVGDGSGFKLGPTTSSAESGFQRTLKNCLAIGNRGPGIDQNASSSTTNARHAIYNSVTANNKTAGFQYYYDHLSTFKNNISYNNGANNEFGTGSTIDHNSWQNGLVVTATDFLSTDVAQLSAARKSDGSLPDITAFKLAAGSDLINAGIDVGLPFTGSAPDLGTAEASTTTTTAPVVQIPVFSSASIDNATPTALKMTYNMTLASITPAVSTFAVSVNAIPRTVSAVAISGTNVQLTLSTAAKFGDVVTVTYTKPTTNPLQSTSGGQAVTITAKTVSNNLVSTAKANAITVKMTISPNHIHKIMNVNMVYSVAVTSTTAELTPQKIQVLDLSGKLFIEQSMVTGTANLKIPVNISSGVYNVNLWAGGTVVATQKIKVY